MKVRPRKHRSGRITWQLDCGKVKGKRVQLQFKSQELARMEMARRKGEKSRIGDLAHALSDEDRVKFVAAREKLEALGSTIEEAVEFFTKHAKPLAGPMTLEKLQALFLEAKREEGLSTRYVPQLKCSTKSFIESYGPLRQAHQVLAADVTTWLKANEWSWKTWNVYRGDVRTMFEWARAEKIVTLNPCDAVVVKKRPVNENDEHDGEIRYLAVAQCERLLRRAAEVRDPLLRRDQRGRNQKIDVDQEDYRDCLAAVVIGLFTGLRPERELGKMTWEHVRLANRLVVVTMGRSKTRERRTVTLPPNAIAWLDLCPFKEGKILPKNFTKKWKRLRQAVGLFQAWPHDGVRHTYCTMHYEHFKDEKTLQVLMGHKSAEMIHKHYRGLTTPNDAAAFYDLWPWLWGAFCPWPRRSAGAS